MTNVQTDQRFRPAELHVRRLSHRVSVADVEEAVDRYAEQFHVPPALFLAVINAESDFNLHRDFESEGDPALSHRVSDA